jgi:hypothetical protein
VYSEDFIHALESEIDSTQDHLDNLNEMHEQIVGSTTSRRGYSRTRPSYSGRGNRYNTSSNRSFTNSDQFDNRNFGDVENDDTAIRNASRRNRIAGDEDEGIDDNFNEPRTNVDGSIDKRTMEGRQVADDEGFSERDLRRFMRESRTNTDGSYDLRTAQARALQAAGWIDDGGHPTDDAPSTRRSSGGNRSGSAKRK